MALGMSAAEARQVLRFSFARTTTLDEVQAASEIVAEIARELAAVGL